MSYNKIATLNFVSDSPDYSPNFGELDTPTTSNADAFIGRTVITATTAGVSLGLASTITRVLLHNPDTANPVYIRDSTLAADIVKLGPGESCHLQIPDTAFSSDAKVAPDHLAAYVVSPVVSVALTVFAWVHS